MKGFFSGAGAVAGAGGLASPMADLDPTGTGSAADVAEGVTGGLGLGTQNRGM